MRKIAVILLSTLFCSAPASATELTTYRCSYARYSDGEAIRKLKNPLEMIFIAELAAKRATTVGNNGSATVASFWVSVGEGVSFVEVTPAHNVMTTVVDSQGTSIHSRHTIMGGQVVPSQYYGRCAVDPRL